MTAASAFLADGGSCFAATVKMYDAASAGVMFAKTGPDCRPGDCTATRPRSAAAAVRGCHPDADEVVVVTVSVGRPARTYQYQSTQRTRMMTRRQPALLRQPFMVCECEGWGRIPRQAESGKGGGRTARVSVTRCRGRPDRACRLHRRRVSTRAS